MPNIFQMWRRRVAMSKAVAKLSPQAATIRNDILVPIGLAKSAFEQTNNKRNLAGDVFLGHIELLDSPEVNAWASPPTFRAHNVFICSGLVIAAFDAACVIFNSRESFKEFGGSDRQSTDALAEALRRLRGEVLPPLGALESDTFLKSLWSQLPTCQKRAGGALLMFEETLRYFTQHELAHAALGHCLFVSKHLGLTKLLEVSRPNEALQGDSENIIQLLEYEADITAATSSLQRAVFGQHSIVGQHPYLVKSIVLGIHVGLWLISRREKFDDAIHVPQASHPNIGFRHAVASQVLNNFCNYEFAKDAYQLAREDLINISRIENNLFGILSLANHEVLKQRQMIFANESIRINQQALAKLGRYRFIVPFYDFSYDGLDYSKYVREK
ncbi:hypothetical protein SAMN04490195_4053 [Pseudomonas moorei]|uniref:Uncharacterized protein n=2 Tax=Pseudomonas moorei TaxID=395599 RepID=A0A1H1HEW0_9PSED|nr:hypothetical protein SAMN04490195_4053 [Pseudomonas moorei]